MAEQPGPELDIDAVGGMRKKIGAQDTEHCFEHPDCDQADDEHVKRAHASMHEDLVDDDLEEQGRNERKNLQEE